jgi:biopolymer transport protein ExbD
MAMNGNESGAYNSEINVTPLVDVVLVLLIIFMMIVPLTLRGYDVDIPGEAVAAPPTERHVEQIVMEITVAACPVVEPPETAGLPLDCTVLLNEEAVPVADLAQRVNQIFAGRAPSDAVLFLAADAQLNYEGVMRIVDVARSGVEELRIGLVTRG